MCSDAIAIIVSLSEVRFLIKFLVCFVLKHFGFFLANEFDVDDEILSSVMMEFRIFFRGKINQQNKIWFIWIDRLDVAASKTANERESEREITRV